MTPDTPRHTFAGMRAAPLALAVLLATSAARAQDADPAPAPLPPPPPPAATPAATPAAAPSSGTLLIVLGALSLAGGALDLGTLPLCYAARVPSSQHPACVGTTVAVGVALLGAGIPLTVLGARRRATWSTWKVGATTASGGGLATWSGSW